METKMEPVRKIQEYLLCNAFGGGSSYWCHIDSYMYPEGKGERDFSYPHLEVPFAGGSITISVPEDNDGKTYTLDFKALQRGWKLLHDKYPHHYADSTTGQYDATTGDVFLQLCLFGDVVYG
jgi:hypothetical protein